jgi:hypothetical protein
VLVGGFFYVITRASIFKVDPSGKAATSVFVDTDFPFEEGAPCTDGADVIYIAQGNSSQIYKATISEANVAVTAARAELEGLVGSLQEAGTAVAATQPELVINAAAYTAVDAAENNVELAHAGHAAHAQPLHERGVPGVRRGARRAASALEKREQVACDAPVARAARGEHRRQLQPLRVARKQRRVVAREGQN